MYVQGSEARILNLLTHPHWANIVADNMYIACVDGDCDNQRLLVKLTRLLLQVMLLLMKATCR